MRRAAAGASRSNFGHEVTAFGAILKVCTVYLYISPLIRKFGARLPFAVTSCCTSESCFLELVAFGQVKGEGENPNAQTRKEPAPLAHVPKALDSTLSYTNRFSVNKHPYGGHCYH